MSTRIRPRVRARSVLVEVCVVRTGHPASAAPDILETRARTAALPMNQEIRVATEGRASTRAPASLPAPAIRVGAAKLVS